METYPQLEATTSCADRIRGAIEALSDEDFCRLELAARICLFGTEFLDPYELLNEAVVRALYGTRHWPWERVPFVAFLIMTMRSIADGSRTSSKQFQTQPMDTYALADGDSVDETWAGTAASPEEAHIELEDEVERLRNAATDIEKIARHFENDHRVQLLITHMKDGKSAPEVCAALGWGKTAYETTLRRLRRGLTRLFRMRKRQ